MRAFWKAPSDEELMRQFVLGDEHAFSSLADRYAQPIFRFVFSMVRNMDDAEELTQEVFLKVVKAKHTFDPEEAFRPWLFRVARNQCLDALRRKGRSSGEALDVNGVESSCIIAPRQQAIAQQPISPRDEAIRKQEQEQVEQALRSLDEKSREVLHLRFYQGLSYKEIAATLGMPENSVSSALIRAVKKLKDIVFTDNGRWK
jgi:RNA polymerase sigma-70 factor (ECF subfamily)